MSDFTPVDHKDSDPEYRRAVRAAVESVVGSTLTDVTEPATLFGHWRQAFAAFPDQDPQNYEYRADGTLVSPYDQPGNPPNEWRLVANQCVQLTWCEPMPDYGMPEGTYEETRYHCAKSDDGKIVLWNGDGSIIITLSPIAA